MKVESSLLSKRRLESNVRPVRARAGRGLPENGMSEAEEVESIKKRVRMKEAEMWGGGA